MRQEKTIAIDTPGGRREVTVYEVRPRDVIDALRPSARDEGGDPVAGLLGLAGSLAPMCTDLELEALLDLYPSEIEAVWQAFRGVNDAFFRGARGLGLDTVLGEALRALRRSIERDLSGFVRASLPPGTGRPGTTDGNSSPPA